MTEKRFTYDKPFVAFSKGGIVDNVTGETYEFTMDTVLDLLNALHEENQALKTDRARYEEECRLDVFKELTEENEQLREHFIYLIGTALEDKECRKIYAKGLLEIFDDCANLDEAKIKIKEYLE